MLLLYTDKGLGGWALLSSFVKQQQKRAYSTCTTCQQPYFIRPQQCVRKHFTLLSYLSQWKVPLYCSFNSCYWIKGISSVYQLEGESVYNHTSNLYEVPWCYLVITYPVQYLVFFLLFFRASTLEILCMLFGKENVQKYL